MFKDKKNAQTTEAGNETSQTPPTKDELNSMLPTDLENPKNLQGFFGALDQAKEQGLLKEISGTYLSVEKWAVDEEHPYVYTGPTKFIPQSGPSAGVEQDAVMLVDRKGESFICASVVLVTALNKVDNIPCGVIIKKLPDVPGKNYTNLKVWVMD